ncbi:MAG TPA: hypothetical protein VNJ04_07110 [Gemmatimonadaceae bacterium]|nr:hypothetical protein [Gemmatimonadaceae bacterium]
MHIVKPDGSVEPKFTDSDEGFNLDELNAMVGGYIKIVYLDKPVAFTDEDDPTVVHTYTLMVMNEDGKGEGMPVNGPATHFWSLSLGQGGMADDILVGPVAFSNGEEVQ